MFLLLACLSAHCFTGRLFVCLCAFAIKQLLNHIYFYYLSGVGFVRLLAGAVAAMILSLCRLDKLNAANRVDMFYSPLFPLLLHFCRKGEQSFLLLNSFEIRHVKQNTHEKSCPRSRWFLAFSFTKESSSLMLRSPVYIVYLGLVHLFN